MTIDLDYIDSLVSKACEPSSADLERILAKADECQGLSLEEAAALLNVRDQDSLKLLTKKAREIKERLYGKRIVLFAPLYLSNYCTNSCSYCGFNAANTGVERTALTPAEAVHEAASLVEMGFKRVLLVSGEDPRYGLDYMIECIRSIYDNTGMRIVHINAPPMDVAQLKTLKDAGVGVYQSFQETYHRPTYERVHRRGAKSNFEARLGVMDRALEAGFEDVGIGPLLGLYDHRFDTLATIAHSMHLWAEFGTHAHTISVPRLRPVAKVDGGGGQATVSAPVTDDELEKIVAVFRLAVPSAGIVITTRESQAMRARLLGAGASQMSAASSTSPGGYAETEKGRLEQFSTSDHRTLAEVIAAVARSGALPSLCTSCYRVGRVGSEFTEKTVSGNMKRLCRANALLTLKEYLLDAGVNGSQQLIEDTINAELTAMEKNEMKNALERKLVELEEGERDLFF